MRDYQSAMEMLQKTLDKDWLGRLKLLGKVDDLYRAMHATVPVGKDPVGCHLCFRKVSLTRPLKILDKAAALYLSLVIKEFDSLGALSMDDIAGSSSISLFKLDTPRGEELKVCIQSPTLRGRLTGSPQLQELDQLACRMGLNPLQPSRVVRASASAPPASTHFLSCPAYHPGAPARPDRRYSRADT